jgi:tripartite motif-containing protein 71
MQRYRSYYKLLLFLFLTLSLVACGGTGTTATSTPGAITDQPGTGPKGLPLYCPLSVTVDHQDNIYVSDNDNSTVRERIIKLSNTGQALSEWHLFPSGNIGTTQGPGSIALDAQGNMFITDLGRFKVLKVSPAGKILTSWGSYGSGSGQFEQPEAIAVDSHGNIYVGDYVNGSVRIEKFSNTGKFLGIVITLAKPDHSSSFSDYHPIGLAVDSNDNLYIAFDISITEISPTDQVLGKVAITDYSSTTIKIWTGIGINAHGDLYVAHLTSYGDSFYPRIMKIDIAAGKSLAVWNVWKSGISLIESIAFDSQGNLYATESTKTKVMQVQKFSPTGEVLATWKGTCGS